MISSAGIILDDSKFRNLLNPYHVKVIQHWSTVLIRNEER